MKLLADKTGEQFLTILEEGRDCANPDSILVQFISNDGIAKGQPFKDSLRGLLLAGWTHRTTSTSIGLYRFSQGYLEDAHVSFALHQLYPLGRKVELPSGEVMIIASYANTHSDGYYMYVRPQPDARLQRMRITPKWRLLPSDKLLALPYYPAPLSQDEINNINDFDRWAGGF